MVWASLKFYYLVVKKDLKDKKPLLTVYSFKFIKQFIF